MSGSILITGGTAGLGSHRAKALAFDPGLVPGTGLARDASGAMKFVWGCVLPKILRALRAVVSSNIHTADESGQNLAWVGLGESGGCCQERSLL